MSDSLLKMSIAETSYAVCRLAPDQAIPDWALSGDFVSVTKTPEELSVVCPEQAVPHGIKSERGWRALKVEGPLDFSLTGILASISAILAQSGISIFAVSTYDTDYILVREQDLEPAVEALSQGPYEILGRE